jgi:hypothetical protein
MGIGKLDRSCTSKEPCRNANGHEPQGQRIGDRGCTDQPLTQYKSNKEGTSRACPLFVFVASISKQASRICAIMLSLPDIPTAGARDRLSRMSIFIFVISEAGANRPCRSVLVFHFGVPARPAF